MDNKSLIELQHKMMHYLVSDNRSITDPSITGQSIAEQSIAKHIVAQGSIDKQTRLNIYKNAYQIRLKEVIDTDHNILSYYLGDDLFEQMVEQYIETYPSKYTSLRNYADHLPNFLSQRNPFCEYPILSEIARFERLLLSAFDALDEPRLTQLEINQIPNGEWPSLNFHFHPSVQMAYFRWNSVESWQALKAKNIPEQALQKNTCWLIWRNQEKLTEFRSLPSEESTLITMILRGENFSELCEFLLKQHSPENVSKFALSYLTAWIEQGILRKF